MGIIVTEFFVRFLSISAAPGGKSNAGRGREVSAKTEISKRKSQTKDCLHFQFEWRLVEHCDFSLEMRLLYSSRGINCSFSLSHCFINSSKLRFLRE